jgi:hypothetical protein
MTTVGVLALVVAVAAAVRSTWSPCGLSMLSAMNPLSERGRGRSFRVSASWFVVGAALGGLTLGIGGGLLALAVGAVGISTGTVLTVAVAAALVAVASDARLLGFRLPHHTRQVNEDWLDWYRAWVYGIGFGWQIGVGFATYIMTAALYLMVVLAALTGAPWVAVACGALFGLVRGLAVLLARPLTSPAAIVALHRRLNEWEAPVRVLVIVVEVATAAAAAAVLGGPWVAVGVGAAGAVAATVGVRGSRAARPLTPAG